MEHCLDLDLPGKRTPEDCGEQLAAGLNRTLRPPVLLALEAVHVDRQLGRHREVFQVDEPPARELRPVGDVEVFGERVGLPASGVLQTGAAPDPRCAVEVEKPAGPVARGVLDHEVAV